MSNDYFLGLDIGTSSVGFAVTDDSYNLIKARGKHFWGMRLFEEAEQASSRRMSRTARRRNNRKKQRIQLLQEIFDEEIAKVDSGFYQRLKDAFFLPEDKTVLQSNTLFDGTAGLNDCSYHKRYETIYHLRSKLMTDASPHDVRLVYLALHHIVKNRGHFLLPVEKLQRDTLFETQCESLEVSLQMELDIDMDFRSVSEVLKKVLTDEKRTKNDAEKMLFQVFETSTPQEKAIATLLAGKKLSLNKLFDGLESEKLCFAEASCDEAIDALEDVLEDKVVVLRQLKLLYDWGVLSRIIPEGESYSSVQMACYEQHKKDLQLLKSVFKGTEDYAALFKNSDEKKVSYSAYVGFTIKKGRKVSVKKCSQEELCKEVLKRLKKLPVENEAVAYLKEACEKQRLLPKQRSGANSVIPYQIHLNELETILANASVYLPFLKAVDARGISNVEKIKRLFTFRIPYYVGPLSDRHSSGVKGHSHAWVVRKSYDKVYPWNFEAVIDVEKSAERFIKRMTNKCTYLVGEDVLPKHSLTYSEFMVRNELNNLTLNGDPVHPEVKDALFNALFKERVTVKRSHVKNYLISENYMSKDDTLSGIDGDFKSSLKAYHCFKKDFGDAFVEKHRETIEAIILDSTLFGADEKMFRKRLKNTYSGLLNDSERKKVLKYRFSDWGRLSGAFLKDMVVTDEATGTMHTVLSFMKQEGLNLMQVLSERYGYKKAIDEHNCDLLGQAPSGRLNYKMVDDLYISPAVKRSTWQSLKIVDEVVSVMKKPPKRLFVEVAREKRDSGRTQSRKAQLLALYKNCKTDERQWLAEIEDRSEAAFRKDKLYLYYTQMGKCLYTGEPIRIEALFDDQLYDIDHIYPQSKVKDDSLDNRVLVKRAANLDKRDTFPISRDIQREQKGFWRLLKQKGFISEKKLSRLERTEPLTAEELTEFIARQLVETRQSSKAVIEVLKRQYPGTEIVYVKAGNVSAFRKTFDFVKLREANDTHHAKDAYLNIVVGNVYHVKFTRSIRLFVKEYMNGRQQYSLNKMFCWDVKRGDDVAWRHKSGPKSIDTVRKVMARNDVLFTRMTYCKTGALYAVMRVPMGKAQYPIKTGDSRFATDRYGGYTSLKIAQFMVVEHTVKGQRVRTLEGLPIVYAKADKRAVLSFLTDVCGLVEPKICHKKVPINALLELDGFKLHLSGKSGETLVYKHTYQLNLPDAQTRYMKKVLGALRRDAEQAKSKKELSAEAWWYREIDAEQNLVVYDLLAEKLTNTVYSRQFKKKGEWLKEVRTLFEELALTEQCFVLTEVFKFFGCSPSTSDLRALRGRGQSWKLTIGKKISAYTKVVLIHQSVTGLYERKVNLLDDGLARGAD